MYLYGAYGSNLNKNQMLARCPNSISYASLILDHYKLVFKGVADIEKFNEYSVCLGVYKITEKCERSLDIYEEFPKIYEKIYVNTVIMGKNEKVMIYTMKKKYQYSRPYKRYFNVIKEGYKDWSFNSDTLVKAGLHSIENNSINGYESKNWKDGKYISSKYLSYIR